MNVHVMEPHLAQPVQHQNHQTWPCEDVHSVFPILLRTDGEPRMLNNSDTSIMGDMNTRQIRGAVICCVAVQPVVRVRKSVLRTLTPGLPNLMKVDANVP